MTGDVSTGRVRTRTTGAALSEAALLSSAVETALDGVEYDDLEDGYAVLVGAHGSVTPGVVKLSVQMARRPAGGSDIARSDGTTSTWALFLVRLGDRDAGEVFPAESADGQPSRLESLDMTVTWLYAGVSGLRTWLMEYATAWKRSGEPLADRRFDQAAVSSRHLSALFRHTSAVRDAVVALRGATQDMASEDAISAAERAGE